MAVPRRFGRLLVVSLACLSAHAIGAQSAQVPALSGTWTLNLDESSAASDTAATAPTPPAPDPPSRPSGFVGATDGMGRPTPFVDPGSAGSLIPQSVNNALNSSGAEKDKGRQLTSAERLLLELSTPPTQLVIAATRDALTLTREGRTDTYLANGKEEKHRCVNGTIKTTTWWGDGVLRQTIDGGDKLKLQQTFQLDDHGRLIVIMRPADDKSLEFQSQLISRVGASASTKGRKRAVYDPEGR